MTTFDRIAALTATAALALTIAGTPPAIAAGTNCVKAGGTATILPNNATATFMANAALKNSIAAQGRTQVGPAKVVCDANAVVPTCTATAKACK